MIIDAGMCTIIYRQGLAGKTKSKTKETRQLCGDCGAMWLFSSSYLIKIRHGIHVFIRSLLVCSSSAQ
jgi:hypothetical protein